MVNVKNCKVIPGEACITQHRLLCCDFLTRNMKMPKIQKGEKRIKLWKLKNEQRRKQFEETARKQQELQQVGRG